jgi:hypothetical protein
VRQHGTVVDAYQREGGAWLERAPVLVNEDFDFALAMGMEGGIGAGLAAGKRKDHNAHKAAVLAGVVGSLDALQQRLKELRCCGVHVYFLLWGAETAVLRTVVDVAGDAAKSRVVESGPRSVMGDAGWAGRDVLMAQAQQSIEGLGCEVGAWLRP